MWHRKRSPCERRTLEQCGRVLAGDRVLSVLSMCLQSQWDATRERAYSFMVDLARYSHTMNFPIGHLYASTHDLLRRGLTVALLPRQREADAAARMIALHGHSLQDMTQQVDFVGDLVNKADTLLRGMKDFLQALTYGEMELRDRSALPLPHGLVKAIRLLVTKSFSKTDNQSDQTDVLLRVARLCESAVKTSLSMMADVEIDHFPKEERSLSTLVNPGAIGANGIFSSVARVDEVERRRRLASQRVVVGTWLLVAESCACLAVVLTSPLLVHSQPALYADEAVALLTTTLTSVKHTGAAFASHKAIQQIASLFSTKGVRQELRLRPSMWLDRLLAEVSGSSNVRNSTLRRSMGYSLGFLSFMRAEVASKCGPLRLCEKVLSSLIVLSLPSGVCLDGGVFTTSQMITNDEELECESLKISIRGRVHALNTLRSIVLDANLATAIRPFVGRVLVSSFLGYSDSSWAVRNSSTMVFSAVLLRSVDADKNAASGETKCCATNIADLFRSYPILSSFLTNLMNSIEGGNTAPLPPLLPILVLLSRVQPTRESSSNARAIVDTFLPFVVCSCGDVDISIRSAAAKALGNIFYDDLSLNDVVGGHLIQNLNSCSNWNHVHGSLKAIRQLLKSDCVFDDDFTSAVKSAKVFTVSWIAAGRLSMPAVCLQSCLDILLEQGETSVVIQRGFELLSWFRDSAMGLQVPGVHQLIVRVSSTVCRLVSVQFWQQELDATPEAVVSQLSVLLLHSSSDVRIHATKAFKRTIYENMDSMIVAGCHKAQLLLPQTVTLLLECIEQERSSALGPHGPNLRRLTRCVLESLECAEKLHILTKVFNLEVQLKLEATLDFLLAQGGQDVSFEAETQLRGNVLELISFLVESATREELSLEGQVSRFVGILKRASDQRCSWRVRHSASVALARSIGSMKDQVDNRVAVEFVRSLLYLLQDSDEDVRVSSTRTYQLPERIVTEIMYSPWFPVILQHTFEGVLTLHDKVKEAIACYERQEQDDRDDDIFTAIDTNSYIEPLLWHHVVFKEVVDSSSSRHDVFTISTAMLSNCAAVLQILVESETARLRCTHDRQVFPPLHALLLASAIVILFHEVHQKSVGHVQTLASHLAQLASRTDEIHPEIRVALDVLNEATFQSEATKHGIARCCFLAHKLPVSKRTAVRFDQEK